MNDSTVWRSVLWSALASQVAAAPANPGLALSASLQSTAAEPRVVLEGADGVVTVRPLKGFECTDPRSLNAWFVRYEGLAKAKGPAQESDRAEVELHSGDRLYGNVRTGRGELLDLELVGGVRVGVALDELKSLIYPRRCLDAWNAAPEPAPEGDRLYRSQRGDLDRIDGGVEEFTTDGVRFHGVLGSKLIPWSEVAALFVEGLAEAGHTAAVKSGVPVVVDLSDQSRVRGALERMDGDGLRMSTHNAERLSIPAAAIAGVMVDDGRVQFLSAIPPADAPPSRPWGDDEGMSWPPRFDRSVSGQPLSAGGRVRARGIGVMSESRLRWKLDAGWKELRGEVAIDDAVMRQPIKGSVVFRIYANGERRWESPVIRGGDPPLAIPRQSLAGVTDLVLEVDMADDASKYMGDHADWVDVVLVR